MVLTLQGYATHAIFDNEQNRQRMMQDYILLEGHTTEVAEQQMLRDLQQRFRKNNSSLEEFGFPMPDNMPTELQEEQTKWLTAEKQNEQQRILQQLNESQPNNTEQQATFDRIMESVEEFKTADREVMERHQFHFISGAGGTGKSALFNKLQAACRAKGMLIAICAATTLAALLYEGGTTAHSLFGYPVVEEEDIDDIHPMDCHFSPDRSEFLREVSVIFWDEIVSNDRALFEAVLRAMSTAWEKTRYYIFICAGDFAQVRPTLSLNI